MKNCNMLRQRAYTIFLDARMLWWQARVRVHPVVATCTTTRDTLLYVYPEVRPSPPPPPPPPFPRLFLPPQPPLAAAMRPVRSSLSRMNLNAIVLFRHKVQKLAVKGKTTGWTEKRIPRAKIVDTTGRAITLNDSRMTLYRG